MGTGDGRPLGPRSAAALVVATVRVVAAHGRAAFFLLLLLPVLIQLPIQVLLSRWLARPIALGDLLHGGATFEAARFAIAVLGDACRYGFVLLLARRATAQDFSWRGALAEIAAAPTPVFLTIALVWAAGWLLLDFGGLVLGESAGATFIEMGLAVAAGVVMAALALVLPVMASEGRYYLDACRRSVALMRGHKRRLVVPLLALGAVMYVLAMAGIGFTSHEAIATMLTAVVGAFFVVFAYLLYRDVLLRGEARRQSQR